MKKLDEPEIRESFVCPNVPEAEGIYVVTDAERERALKVKYDPPWNK